MPLHDGYVHVYVRGCEATAPQYRYLSRANAPETLSTHSSMRKETAFDIILRIRRASSKRGAKKRARSDQELKILKEKYTVLF